MNATEETPAKTPRFGRATKFSFAGGIGAVALGIGAIVALPALTASAAYAVEPKDDGNIRVEIRSPEDAAGLAAALAEHGIKAQVDYPPDGMMCDPDRFTDADLGDSLGPLEIGMAEDVTEEYVAFEVDPDDFSLNSDTTLVIELSEGYFDNNEDSLSSIGVAEGEIGDCAPYAEFPESGGGEDDENKDDDGSKDKD